MKESFEPILLFHLARIHAAFALRTSSRAESNDPKEQGCNPHKDAKIGNFDPIANTNGNSQNRNAAKLNPRRQVWIFSDRVIPPFLILSEITRRLVLELENDWFHIATQMMPNP